MKIFRGAYEKQNIPTTVALGCFDGVHIAHARVITEAVELSRKNGTKALVWCFAEPPKNAFLTRPVPLITGLFEKTRLIEALGADILVCPDFTREIAAVSAEDFVRELLCSCSGAVHLVSGKNYSFGRGGEGNSAALGRICAELGIGYTVVDDVTVDGEGVSSTEIRRAVSEGKLEYAARLLGRNFSLSLEYGGGRYSADPCHLAPPAGTYRARLVREADVVETIARFGEDGGVSLSLADGETLSDERITLEFPFDRC